MNDYKIFLEILGHSILKKEPIKDMTLSAEDIANLMTIARIHKILPLISDTLFHSLILDEIQYHSSGEEKVQISKGKLFQALRSQARKEVILQARRTAEFLKLYQFLSRKGLNPLVMKGIICRSLYPQPEQRPSVDEDLLIPPDEFRKYHQAFFEYGLKTEDEVKASEVTYESQDHLLCIELHMSPFPPESDSYGDCNQFFADVFNNRITTIIYGVPVHTLGHTDHLLYMICHAYKHFLHGGFGIRQVCDILLFSDRYADNISWEYIRNSCEKIRIHKFVSAMYRIGEKHLGFPMVNVFADIEVDETDLLNDILAGGIYGVEDINRAHSSTMTIDAVASQKKGRKTSGPLYSIFLPLKNMKGKYPYLERFPILLPVAWGQRIISYLVRQRENAGVQAGETLRIGQERIKILKKYGIID